MRQVLVLLVIFGFLVGCTPLPSPEPRASSPNITSPPLSSNDSPPSVQPPSPEIPLDRYYDARGLGLLDFRTMTAENCLSLVADTQEQRALLTEDVEDTRDDLEKEQVDLEQERQAYEDSLSSGNDDFIREQDEELHDQEDDYEAAEERLKDFIKLQEKYDLVIDEAHNFCLYLRASHKP